MSPTSQTSAPDSTETICWYVLYCMPQHEKKIAARLEKKGLELYLPLTLKTRRWTDRTKRIAFPLFPGYLFTRMNYLKDRLTVLQEPGALQFLKDGNGNPAVFPDREMEHLQRFISILEDLDAEPIKKFESGQRVRVIGGSLKGLTGTILSMKNSRKLYVEVPLLGQMVSSEIDALDLEVELLPGDIPSPEDYLE